MENIQLFTKVAMVIDSVGEKYLSTNDVMYTYGLSNKYYWDVINYLEKKKLIKTKKEGRNRKIDFTVKGARVYGMMKKLQDVI